MTNQTTAERIFGDAEAEQPGFGKCKKKWFGNKNSCLIKKLLTTAWQCDILLKLSLETATKKNKKSS